MVYRNTSTGITENLAVLNSIELRTSIVRILVLIYQPGCFCAEKSVKHHEAYQINLLCLKTK